MGMNKTIEEIRADYHLFIDIQMAKYLKLVKRSAFESNTEAEKVIGKIIETYNAKIANQHERLDNSSREAKIAWFNFIAISFMTDDNFVKTEDDNYDDSENANDVIENYDTIFPFLPKGAVMFLLLANPALEASGFRIDKFKQLLDGQKPTTKEKEVLIWAHDIAFGMMAVYLEKDETIKEEIYKTTLKISREKLKASTAQKVVEKILANIKDHFKDLKNKDEK